MQSPRFDCRSLIGILLIPVFCGGVLLGQTDLSSKLAGSEDFPQRSTPTAVSLELPDCELHFRGTTKLSAPNLYQALEIEVTDRSLQFAPRSSNEDWQFDLELTRWGRGSRLIPWPECSAPPLLDGPRVRYLTPEVESWIENRECGLEHGWTVYSPPSPPTAEAPLTIELSTSGLKLVLADDSKSVALSDDAGCHVLDYDTLFAWDSKGESLPCWFSTENESIRIYIDDKNAEYPIEIDPVVSSTAFFAKTGDQSGSEFGFSVVGGADLTGDGQSDLVVGAKNYDADEVNAGAVFIFAGVSGAPPSTNPTWSAVGDDGDSNFGQSVALAGDVNGDGLEDLLIGAPGKDMGGGINTGQVCLFLGPLLPGALRTPADASWSANGPHPGAKFGISVAGAGDVNGDGFADFLIGAPEANVNNATRGRAYLYFGSSQGPIDPPLLIDGQSTGDQFGWVVSSAGNLDGDPDGRSEILVAAPQRSEGSQLFLGTVYSYRWNVESAQLELIWQVFGLEVMAQFGSSLAGGHDIDGMGYDDVVIGAPFASSPEPNIGTGAIYLFRGESLFEDPETTIPVFMASVSADWEIYGDQVGESLGSSVALIERLDEDFIPDIVTGSPFYDLSVVGGHDAGRLTVFLGKSVFGDDDHGPFSGGFDSPNDGGDRVYRGSNGEFGGCVTSAGDLDGDGLTDLAVGAPRFDGGLLDEGQVTVYLGFEDCNENQIPDGEELASEDCDNDGLLDDCEDDCDADGVPDDCQGTLETFTWSGSLSIPATGQPEEVACTEANLPPGQTTCGFSVDGAVTDLDLVLSLEFTEPDFLLYLTHPSGSPSVVVYDGSGDFLSNLPIRFDDEGSPQSLSPTQPFELFDLSPIAGDWKLEIEVPIGREVTLYGYSIEAIVVDSLLGDCNGNGVSDACEAADGFTVDCNFDLIPDECQDRDGDGVADSCDNCPDQYNLAQSDFDSDGIGNLCDSCPHGHNDEDADLDGIPDGCDNCPSVANPGQEDCDLDDVGNSCETDCNANGEADDCEILDGLVTDCNSNGIPDECDALNGVTVELEPPVISDTPLDLQVSADPGICSALVDWVEPTATDNCQLVSLESSHQVGSEFPVGETVVTYTATDISGLVTQTSFTISVVDLQQPLLIGLPTTIMVEAMPGQCEAQVEWEEPSAIDNCGTTVDLVASIQSGSVFPVGPTTVEYTATDSANLMTVGSFTVVVSEADAPFFTLVPGSQTLGNDQGQCGAVATWIAPQATDLCQGVTVLTDHDSGSFFSIGTTVVTCTAIDDQENMATSTFSITVLDSEPPTLSGVSSDLELVADPGQCGAMVTWPSPMVGDNCPDAILTISHSSNTMFPIGTTTVTCTATDSAGHMDQKEFEVTVSDTQSPALVGVPSDQMIPLDPGSCTAAFAWTDPQVIDNCPGAMLQTSIASGSSFIFGTTTVSFIAIDAVGNSAQASFNVTVLGEDCDQDGVPDECEEDCDNSGIPDDCELESIDVDCNQNGMLDVCEIDLGLVEDCQGDGIPDLCQEDCDSDGLPDDCEPDCNLNGIPDQCEADYSSDCDGNGVPDFCESDCDGDGVADICELLNGDELDQDMDGIPDSCECDPPSAVTCTLHANGDTLITWVGSYDSVTLTRDGFPIAELSAGTISYLDTGLSQQCLGVVTYEVAGRCHSGGTVIEEFGSCALTFTPALQFQYRVQDASIPISSNGGSSLLSASIMIEELPTSFCQEAMPTTGFSMAVVHDAAMLTPVSVEPGAALATLSGGWPEFFSYQTSESGWTLGVIYSMSIPQQALAFSTEREVVVATYSTNCNVSSSPIQTELGFQNGIGSPPVENWVVVSGFEYAPAFAPGTITLNADQSFVSFARGDCNQSGNLSVGDAVLLLNEIFNGGMQLSCLDACDVNNSGSLNIADPLYLLSFLFMQSTMPPGGLGCALDTEPFDGLDCGYYDACLNPCAE